MTDVDLNVHRKGPYQDEFPYGRVCEACGAFWPCPTRAAELKAEATEVIATVRAQVNDDARRVGVLALVERGVSVWSSTRRDPYGEALGGVVVEIEDDVDRGTGEIARWFTCLSLGAGKTVEVERIAEAEVLQTGVQATDGSTITKLVKKLAGEVHDAKGSYLDLRASERVRWQYVLTGVANLAA